MTLRNEFTTVRCVQCRHVFTPFELMSDFLAFYDKSKTITCPCCGVENVR